MKKHYFIALYWATLLCGIFVTNHTTYAQAAFTCSDGVSYQLRGTPSTLYTVNLRTGQATELFSATALQNRNLTGLGYNVADNRLYASVAGTNEIVIIGSDGIVVPVNVPALPIANYTGGDVTVIGGIPYLILYEHSALVMQRINLQNYSVSPIVLTQGGSVSDISINKEGTMIYGLSGNTGYLVSWPITGGALIATNIGSYIMDVSTFIDENGDLFAISDVNGTVFQASQPNNPTYGSMSQITPTLNTALTNTDGARCANSSALNTPVPFECTPNQAFVITSGPFFYEDCNALSSTNASVLHTYDLSTGTIVATSPQLINEIGPRKFFTLNNLGYNRTDNYLWAYKFGTNQLVRIAKDYTVDHFSITGLSNECFNTPPPTVMNSIFNSGDIDANGIMYLFNGINGDRISRVDLNPSSPTYLTKLSDVVLSINPAAGTLSSVQDMAFNPIDNLLYTVSANNNLIRINPLTGLVTSLGPVSGIPPGPTLGYVVAYFDADGSLYVQRANEGNTIRDILKIPNVSTGNLAGSIHAQGEFLVGGDGARCPTSEIILRQYTIGGNVFDDGNGLNDPTGALVNISGTGALNPINGATSLGTQLYVTLVDSEGNIVETVPVTATGTYQFDHVIPGNYTTVLGTDPDGTTTANSPLADGWVNTGEQIGGVAGNTDGTPNGIVSGITVVDSDIMNINFGINKKPVVEAGTDVTRTNPGGTIQSPVASTLFKGSDLEDGSYTTPANPANNNLKGKTVDLEPGTGGDVYYNGVKVTANDPPITNFDPALVTVDPAGTFGGVDVTVTFTYATTDNAGVKSDPQTITVPFTSDPLPVTLVSFTVQKSTENNSALIKWSTATETKSDKFEIERSTNGKEWNIIGTVPAKIESSILTNYSYTTNTLATGLNYFRLKMVDIDKTFSYSRIESLLSDTTLEKVTVYPNPVGSTLYLKDISLSQVKELKLINSLGKTVIITKSLKSNEINVSSLNAGLYILQISNIDGTVTSRKVIVMK